MLQLCAIEALIFAPDGHLAVRWLQECYQYCAERGYRVLAVVTRWVDVERYVYVQGWKGVVVVPYRGLLPPDRLPRIESLADPEPIPEPALTAAQRRVRRPRRILEGD